MPPRETLRRSRSMGPADVPANGSDTNIEKASNEHGGLPSPGKGSKRRAKDLGDASQPTITDKQQSQLRRNIRRKAGTGTTDAQADACIYDEGEAQQALPHALPTKAKGPSPQAGPDGDSPYEAVVKVFVIHCEPNFSLPWQRKRQYSSGSSGFIIPGNRILTNAHCVADHTQVKVKRRGSDTKYGKFLMRRLNLIRST